MNPRFYFAVCQFGAEKAMREEILQEFPHLRFAFSRPGFVTFKEDDDQRPLIQKTNSVFCRLFGLSFGQSKSDADLEGLVSKIPAGATVHCFERDTFVPGDEPEGFVKNARIDQELGKLKTPIQRSQTAEINKNVFDLVWIDEGHVFLGRHTHLPHLDSAPGNQPNIPLPPSAPSRAYLKIEEAIHRFKPKLHSGIQVLEVGCSPGGATTAMLSRGLAVTGVDPKFMAESLYKQSKFQFVQKIAKAVTTHDLNRTNPDWLVMDMNLAPLEALDELHHVIQTLKTVYGRGLRLKTGFLTIKLNDWKFADNIPLYLKRIKELGFQRVKATQLCSNRQEFFVYAEDFR